MSKSPEPLAPEDRLDEETEQLIVKLVDRAYWEGRNESTSPAINERVQEKYDALRSRIRELEVEAHDRGMRHAR